MRDREASTDARSPDTVMDYTVGPILPAEARAFILRYEWLQSVGHPRAHYGAHNALGELAAVALFGTPSQTTAADICGTAHRHKAIVLERGAGAHWAHQHTASWFLPRACAMAALDHGWRIFTAYCDPDAGEVGTIYQACNWLYLGQGSDGRVIAGHPRAREYFRRVDDPADKWISERTWRYHGGRVADLAAGRWVREMRSAKHRYVTFAGGTRRERSDLLSALTVAPRPYPYADRLSRELDQERSRLGD
jgi:hypothetical protein